MRISDWSSDVCSSDLGKFDFVLISGEKQERRLLELNLIRPGDYAFQGYPKFELVAKMAARPLRLFDNDRQIGRASCRERVWQYVSISVVAVALKKKKIIINTDRNTVGQSNIRK